MAKAKKSTTGKFVNFSIQTKDGKNIQFGFTALNSSNKDFPRYNEVHKALMSLEAGHTFSCTATITEKGNTQTIDLNDLAI